jgi:hypothetical protein
MLEHVHRNHAVRSERRSELLEVAVTNVDTVLLSESVLESGGVAGIGLNQDQLAGASAPEYEIRHGSDARSGLDCTIADPTREGIDDPVVIVPGFRNRFELGSGI